LELISFYELLLNKKQGGIVTQIERLERGLSVMENTTKQVDTLKTKLELTMEEVGIEKVKTDELIEIVTKEAGEAAIEEEKAAEQEAATNIVANAAEEAMATANRELEAAVPAMEAARDAVDCLSVKSI
jgi:dynein heavy chain